MSRVHALDSSLVPFKGRIILFKGTINSSGTLELINKWECMNAIPKIANSQPQTTVKWKSDHCRFFKTDLNVHPYDKDDCKLFHSSPCDWKCSSLESNSRYPWIYKILLNLGIEISDAGTRINPSSWVWIPPIIDLFVWCDSLRPCQQFFQLCWDWSCWVKPALSKD